MKLFKGSALGLWWGALSLVASCGGHSTADGTDSNTHWLQDCEHDDDCGALSCVCGVCSKRCDAEVECASLGSDASCELQPGCGDASGTYLCTRGPSGAGGSSAGPPGADGGVGPGADPACPAMDAHDGQANCGAVVGYSFNGRVCTPISCACEGSDCEQLFASIEDCDRAYAECYQKHGVTRSCDAHADCGLQARTCCASCGPPELDSLIAVNGQSLGMKDAGLCWGDPAADCGKCVQAANPTVYSACVDGQCRLLDVAEYAECTKDEDCGLRTKDCCSCGGDFTGPGLVSVDASFVVPEYCQAELSCTDCEGAPAASNAFARCDTSLGKCQLLIVPR